MYGTDFTFTGFERDLAVAEKIETLIRVGADDLGFEGIRELQVHEGFQPYISLRLASGAEFQVTPVISALPAPDGQDRCDECGDEVDHSDDPDGLLCRPCWMNHFAAQGLDPATGDPR